MENILDPYTLRIAIAMVCYGFVALLFYVIHVVLRP